MLRTPRRRGRRGIVVDLFAGGGGASVGIEAALGRPVDVAINHDKVALAVHARNHPNTLHLVENVWRASPRRVVAGRHVELLWASPDCTHFSNAKGAVPKKQTIRSLAWVVVKWAQQTRPDVIMLENVQEFRSWGPLDRDGNPIRKLAGKTFGEWVRALERLGYSVDHAVLDSSEHGAPTRRRRLFVVARADGQPIVWPAPTHGPGLKPFHTAAECIDWALPVRSIFGRRKPLAEKTHWRIAQGILKFVLDNPEPFIVKVNHGKRDARVEPMNMPLTTVTANRRGHAIVVPNIVEMNHKNKPRDVRAPLNTITSQGNRFLMMGATLVQSGYGEREGQRARVPGLGKPIGTMVNGQKHAVVGAWMAKHYGDPKRKSGGGRVVGSDMRRPTSTATGRDSQALAAVSLATFRGTADNQKGARSVTDPMPTISSGGGKGGVHVAEVRAFLVKYYRNSTGQRVDVPADTITSRHRLGLVTVAGIDYQIVDIGMRMLEPHELLRAQFGRYARGYDLSPAKTKAKRVHLIGNSVPPELAEQLVRANLVQARRRRPVKSQRLAA